MKALFFDLDGTLTDISKREIEVIYDTVNHFGIKVSRTRVKQLCVQMPDYLEVFKKLGLELTDATNRYWISAFVKRYYLSVIKRGVASTLAALSKKLTLGCVTSRETQAEVIQELGFLRIDRWFNHVITRDVAAKYFRLTSLPFFPFNEHRRKLYECALAMARCSPIDAVVIGDMGSELRPAKELGMTTIGLVTYGARKNELLEMSDFMISRITQLQNALDELGKSQRRQPSKFK